MNMSSRNGFKLYCRLRLENVIMGTSADVRKTDEHVR